MANGSAGMPEHEVWTADRLFAGPGETSAASRVANWSDSALGPVETWPVELLAAVRTVLPSRRPMLLWWGPELVQIFNDAYRPVLGEKYPAAIGQPGAQCWAEAWEQLGPLAEQVMRGDTAADNENQLLLIRRHGYLEETYWTFSYSPVRAEDGTVAGIFVSTTDVTVRVLGERRLETLRKLGTVSITEADSVADACRAAVDMLTGSSPDLPFVTAYVWADEDERDELRLVASFGVDEGSELAPRTLTAETDGVVWQVGRSGAAHRVAGLADGFASLGVLGTAPVVEAVVLPLAATGQPRPIGALMIGISPYREFDDAYEAFLELVAGRVSAALADVQIYDAQRRRLAALAELDTAKTRFFQNVSHEFRTPLTLLLDPIRAVLDQHADQLPAGQRDAVAAAYRAALRLRRLVDGLLDVASAEADQLHARPEPIDPVALTAECAGMFRSAAEAAGLELVLDLRDGTGDPVALDPDMWAKIVLNLLSNAVKYTTAGSITVRLRDTGDELVLAVTDTGIGIAPAEQSRVFERFHQVADGSGRSSEGTGIGLSLVADLAGALGGAATVASTPGAGSTFTVSVPRKPWEGAVPAGSRTSVADLGAPYLAETEQWHAKDMPRLAGDTDGGRVLLVEDNADMRGYLMRLLREQGWTVDAVADADTALAHARETPPDLVLSDVVLPGPDGLELLRAVRADPLLVRVPMILLTARAGASSATDGLRHGADDYVVKPFDPAELVARVRVHLELSRLREALITASDEEARTLRRALDTRSTISQAVGLLMALHRCDADVAFGKLAELSKNRNVKVRVLAERIVDEFTASLAGT